MGGQGLRLEGFSRRYFCNFSVELCHTRALPQHPSASVSSYSDVSFLGVGRTLLGQASCVLLVNDGMLCIAEYFIGM